MKVIPILFPACCLPRCCASACPVSGALPITPLGTRLIPGLCKNSPVASSCRPLWEWIPLPFHYQASLGQVKGQVFDTNVQMTLDVDNPPTVYWLMVTWWLRPKWEILDADPKGVQPETNWNESIWQTLPWLVSKAGPYYSQLTI